MDGNSLMSKENIAMALKHFSIIRDNANVILASAKAGKVPVGDTAIYEANRMYAEMSIAAFHAYATECCAHLYAEDDFTDDTLIPTVIYVEKDNDSQIVAGVWQTDHYELETGDILASPWEEIKQWPGSYNTYWRIWDKMPTETERAAAAWKGKFDERPEKG